MLGDVRHARSEHESSPLSPCMYSPSRGLLLQQAPPTPERPAPRGRIPTPCSPADSGHAPDVLPLPTPVKWLPRGRSEAVGGANASEPPRERSFFPPANAGTPPISQPLPAPHPPQPPPFATRHPWGHILLSPPDSPRDACARPPFAWASGRPEPHLIGGGFSGVDSKNEGLPGAIGSGGCAAGGNGPEKRSYKPRWSPRDPRDGVVAGERRVAAEVDAGCSFAGVCGGPPPGDGAAGWFSRRGHVYGGPTPALSGLPRARPVPAAAARLIDVSRVLPAVLRSASPVPQQPPPGLRMRRAASLSQDTDDELPAAACDGLTEDEKEIARGQVAAYDRLAAAARPPAPHPAAALLLQQGQPRGLVYPQVQPTARVVPVEAPLVPVGTRVISQLAKLQNDVASILEFSNSLDAKIGSLGCEVRDSARNIDEQSLRLEAIASQTVTADTAKDERDSEMLEQLEARGSWGTLLRGAHEKAEQMARELDDLLRSDAERPRYRRASAPAGGLAAGGRPSGGVAPRSGSHGGEGGGAPPCRRKPLSGSPPATPAVLPEPATLPGWEQSPLMVLSPPCADEVVAAGNSEWSPITMASLSGGRRSRTSDAAHPAPRNERGQAPACTSPPASRGKQQPGRHTARHAFSRAKPQSPGEREPNFAKADCSPLKDALDTLPPCSSPPGPRGKQQPGRHTARHAAGHAFSCAKPQSPGEREPNFEKADCSPLKDAFDTCSSSRVSSLAALVATGGSSHEAPHAADAGTRKSPGGNFDSVARESTWNDGSNMVSRASTPNERGEGLDVVPQRSTRDERGESADVISRVSTSVMASRASDMVSGSSTRNERGESADVISRDVISRVSASVVASRSSDIVSGVSTRNERDESAGVMSRVSASVVASRSSDMVSGVSTRNERDESAGVMSRVSTPVVASRSPDMVFRVRGSARNERDESAGVVSRVSTSVASRVSTRNERCTSAAAADTDVSRGSTSPAASRSWTHDHQPAPPHLPARPGGGAAAHAVDGSGDTAPRMTGPASADDGTLSDDRHGLTSSEPDTFPAARSVTQSPCAGACSADSECSDAPASGRPRPETRSQFQHAAPGLSAGGGWGPSQASTIAVYPRGFRDCESGCSVLAGEGMTPSQTSTTVYPRGFRDRDSVLTGDSREPSRTMTTVYPRGFRDRERECSVLADDGRAHSQATVYPRGFPGRENESGVPGSWAVRGTEDTSPHYRRGTDGASGACGQRARSESEARSLAARDILSSLAGRPAGDADQGSSPGLAVESFPRPDRGSVPRAAGAGAQAASRRRGGGVAVKPARPALDQVRGVSPERFAPREDRPASPGCGGGGGGAVAGHNHVERASTRPTGGPTAGLTSSWGGQVRRASPGGAEPSKAEKSRCTVAPQPDLSRGCSPHSFSSWAEHPRASSTEQVHRVSGGTEPSKVETSRQTIAQQPDLSRGCSPLSFSSWAEHPSACSIEQAHRASSGSTQPSKADTARQIVAPQSDLSPCNYSSRAEHPNTCSIEQVHRASGSTQPSKADTARQIVAPQSDLSPCNYSSRAEHPSTCSIEQVHRASGSTQPSIAEPSCQTVARLPDPSRGCSPRNFSSWGEHPSTSSIEQVHRSTEPSKAETSRQTVAQRPDQSRGCSQRKFVSCGGQSRTCSTEQLHRAASCCGTEPSCVPRGCAPESLGSSGGQSRTCRGSRNVGGTGAGGREAGTDDPSCENHAGEEQTRAGSSARVPSSSRCSTEELHRTGVVSSARDLPGRKQANGHASIKPRAPSPLQKSAQRSEGSHAEAIRAVSPSTRSRMTGPTGSGASIARAADSVRPRTPPSPHEGAHRSDSRLSPAKHANRAGAIQADSPAGHSHRRPSVSNASIVCAVDTIQPRTPSPLHKGAQRSDSRLSQAKHVERADAVQASSPAGRSHRGPPGSNVSNAPIACAVDTIQPRTLSPLHKGAQQSDSRLFQAKHEVKRAAAIQASSPAGKSHKAPPGSNAPNASIACAVDVGSLSGHDGARYELACDGCDEEGPATRPAAPSLELSERAWAAVEDKGGVDPVSCFGQRRHAVRTDRPPHAPSDIRADSASSSAERVGAERRLAIAASLAADGRPHGGSPSTARSVLRPRDPNVEILPAASKPGRAAGAADKGKASPLGELHSSPRSFLSGRSTSLLRSLAPSAHKQEVQLEAIVTSRQLKYESACRALMSGDNEAARTLLLQCASDGQVMTNSLKACFAAQME
ncbi:hypothetical protein DIPPA_25974 [Diplonema papillatum]|nr:hypothetical protein DIPPA_25974 [Diplonema papillatum]